MYICFIGDSLVNGTGDPECLGWAGRICVTACRKGHDLTYYNLGIRGETSADIQARWLGEVTERMFEGCDRRIIFSFGVNDTTLENGKTRVEFNDSIQNAEQILKAAKLLCPVLMVGPPPVVDPGQSLRIAHLSKQFAWVCHGLSIPYLEVFTPLQTSVWLEEAAANDGSHPNSAGYAELALLVQSWSSWLAWFE